MLYREKVIKGLEETEIMLSQAVDRGGGMSVIGAFKCLNSVTDTIALLKEQEPKSVLSNRVCESDQCRYVRKGFCPKCHQEVEWLLNRSYCGFCGQAVKWDDN